MGLLDELKKRAAEKEAQRASNMEDDARADALRAGRATALFRINTNLAALVKQPNILGDEYPVSLQIPGIGEVAAGEEGGAGAVVEDAEGVDGAVGSEGQRAEEVESIPLGNIAERPTSPADE